MFKNLSIHVNCPPVAFIKNYPYIFRRIVKGLAVLLFKQLEKSTNGNFSFN